MKRMLAIVCASLGVLVGAVGLGVGAITYLTVPTERDGHKYDYWGREILPWPTYIRWAIPLPDRIYCGVHWMCVDGIIGAAFFGSASALVALSSKLSPKQVRPTHAPRP